MEEFCSQVAEDKPKNVGGISVLTTALIVSGALVVCANVWWLVLAKVVRCWRNRPNMTEYDDVYPSRASYVSVHLYEEVAVRPPHVTEQTYADEGKRPSYLEVQS
jgi:hypothetical protein